MINYYPLLRIVRTGNPMIHRYIWADTERTYPHDWIGFFRGCEGALTYERYSHAGDDVEFVYNPWAVVEPVVDLWVRNGLPIEDAEPEWEALQAKSEEE